MQLHPDGLGKKAFKNSEPPAKPNREPIDDLGNRYKADSKTKPTETAEARDEVQPSHLWQPLVFWNKIFNGLFSVQGCNLP